MNELIGKPIDRVDGRLKVTGQAKYAAEFEVPGLAYAVTVQSTIASGRVKDIDSSDAEKIPGIIKVITYKNALPLKKQNSDIKGEAGGNNFKLGEKNLLPLQDDLIYYNGQHIAIVVAETFEIAEHAAKKLKVDYFSQEPLVEMEDSIATAYTPKDPKTQISRGDETAGAERVIEQTYTTPVYHHNAMEPHATVAVWSGDKLTLYDSTQNVMGSRDAVAYMLGIPKEKVHLLSPFIGGGFGSKGFVWPHTVLAPMAAKICGRPVKIVLDRQQMFTSNGHRARTIQAVKLGAGIDGKLHTISHETTTETSYVDEFVETSGLATSLLYHSPNLAVKHKLVKLNKGTPCPTRAPGEATGTFALEVAMDELAHKLNIDPVALRLTNYADKNPQDGKAWSAKYLKECYEKGAALIGWHKRNPVPGSVKEGRYLVGYGMATAVYPANRSAASAKVQVFADGTAVASSCTQDIGTGTYTIMTQIAAESLGLPVNKVTFKLGDSDLPKSPGSGGSQSAASAGGAVRAAALFAKSKLVALAVADSYSPLQGEHAANITVENGILSLKTNPEKRDSYRQILARNNMQVLEAEGTTTVSTRETPDGGGEQKPVQTNPFAKADEEIERKQYSFYSFGAQFAKVLVDADLGTVKVAHLAGVMDIGKILNLKTGKNQIMGGMIFALGMALMEESIYDRATGRPVTRDLANYLVPVNADIPEISVEFINKPDPYISPLGARGIGEIGITGATAAIVNAVFNATGKRIRNLPVTPDKLII